MALALPFSIFMAYRQNQVVNQAIHEHAAAQAKGDERLYEHVSAATDPISLP
jgi:hypothetical protein